MAYKATVISLKGSFCFISYFSKGVNLRKPTAPVSCLFSKANELFRSVMNSSSKLPPRGLILRLRELTSIRRWVGPFLNNSFFSHLSREPNVREWGWLPGVDLLLQMERIGRQIWKQMLFLGKACRGSQCPSVEELFYKGGVLLRRAAKSVRFYPESQSLIQ